jgi:hypothetical protein
VVLDAPFQRVIRSQEQYAPSIISLCRIRSGVENEAAMGNRQGGYERRAGCGEARLGLVRPFAVALSIAGIGAIALSLTPPLMLPALSGILTIAAVALAALGRMRPADRRASASIAYWDISGALCLVACGAAVFGEADSVLPLMEEIKLQR